MAIVRIGQWLAAVDDRLLELAAQCSSVEQFCVEAQPGASVRLNLRWTQPGSAERWIQLDGEGDQPGMYCIQGNSLRVCIPADAPAAEAAVRALFQIATLRQGGVLLHAASASFGHWRSWPLDRAGRGSRPWRDFASKREESSSPTKRWPSIQMDAFTALRFSPTTI